jgi:hypothetical protein
VFLLAAQEEPGRPARREPAHPPRGTYPWQAADVVAGVSALRCGNPICRCGSSKGLTFNPFTLAGRWITAADRMIQNMTMAPDEGATSTMKEEDHCEALAREAVRHVDRHLLFGGDGAGDYRVSG